MSSTGAPIEPAPDKHDAITALGWDAGWQAARAVVDADAAWQPVRIAAEHRGAYHALGPGGVAWVELTGRAFHAAGDKRALPTVGDWVLVERWPRAVAGGGAATVREILPRRSFLVRRAAGEATAPQPLAANVNTGLILTSANADLSPARLDRYVRLLRDGGIAPVLVLSKIDLVADPAPLLAALAPLVAATAEQPAGRVLAVSTIAATDLAAPGLAELRALGAPGTTTVLLGSSGVGKSSLLNLLAGTTQATRAIRDDDRGRHTTTRRELFIADGGGLWIDTPGMRELGHWIDGPPDASDDESAFADIAALAAQCKFRDCRHVNEPGCAVRATIPAPRLASFHKLTTERRTGAARQSAASRIAETRRAKAKKPVPSKDE